MNKRFLSALLVLMIVVSFTVSAQATGLLELLGGKKEERTVTISQSEYDELIALRDKYAKMEEVQAYIDTYFYQEPDDDLMLEYALRGMLTALDDNYTFYYNEQEWSDLWSDDEGEYGGIGVQLQGNYTTGIVTITRVFKNTPAEEAGMRKGDQLIRVEDIDVDPYSMSAAVNVMRGLTETTVNVEVIRDGENIIFDIPRALISINRVEYTMLPENVGYIVLYEFAGECDVEVENALKALEAQGATSLIIDLRDNGGGWVSAAQNISDLFLDRTLLFYAQDRSGAKENYYTKAGKTDIPLYFLVNGYSASSSEILAGSLQDLGRATVVGTQSFGKGIIQYVIPLTGEKDGFQFTCAQYFYASGKAVHKIGVTPDVIVEQPEEQVNAYFELGDLTDTQLNAAWQLATGTYAAPTEEAAAAE